MLFDDLREENIILYAMKAYNSPHCIMSEFESDYKRTKYLKRLFRRYKLTGELRERLILNHIILLYNVFDVEPATRILFFRVDEKDYDVLKTFLVYLNYMPERVKGISGKDIASININIDENITKILEAI
jgi:hypothetical protein